MNRIPSSSPDNGTGRPHIGKRIIGASQMADLVRAHDWSATSLGAIENWSETLVAMANLVLTSPVPTVIYWGSDLVLIYNDPYVPFLDTKHPGSLGRSARLVWAEAWHIVGPQFEAVLTKGESTHRENFLIPVQRGGRLQDCYWNYVFSPVYECGHVAGILNTCQNTTDSMLATLERDAIADQLSQALQATTDGVVNLDREWRITYLNPCAEEILAPSGHVVGLNLWQAFPSLVYPGSPYVEHYHRAMNEGVAAAFEAYYPAPLHIWVQVRVRPSQDGIVLFFHDVTERRLEEETRRESEAKLKLATEAAELGIFVWYVAQDRVTWENDRIYDIFGRKREDGPVNAATFATQIVHPDYAAAFRRAINETLQRGSRFFFQGMLIRGDGTSGWVEFTGQLEYDKDGLPWRMLGTAVDITLRKRTEEALRESEVGYRSLFENNMDAIFLTVPDGSITAANPAACAMLGMTEEELCRLGRQGIVDPEDPHLDSALRQRTSAGKVKGELILIRRDGTRLIGEVHSVIHPGNDLTSFVIVRDITERKQSEEALRESETKLKAIYDTTHDYIGLLTPAGVVLDSNQASLAFAGNTREDVLGIPLWETPWFRNTPGASELLRQSIARAAAGEFIRYEALLFRPSGEGTTFDFSITPVRAASGDVLFLIPEGRDVTELKRAETALLQSEKLAAVGRLAASIAHEINNPLESVTNLLYLARRSEDKGEIRDYLDTAERELRRVAAISIETLRFHKQSTNPKAVTYEELVDSVLSIHQGRLINGGVDVRKRIRATRTVLCFDGEIRQVINNVVGNAIDAMHPGGGHLLIRSRDATSWKTGRKGLVLTIADNGCGISPTVMKRIFDAFFTTKGMGGTGLGLWVSQEIVARHHGGLRVRSTQKEGHRGTVVTLFLPFDASTR